MIVLDAMEYATDGAARAAWNTISGPQKIRIEADGGTVIDEAWMNLLLQTITNQSLTASCKFIGDANIGVKKDGSNLIETFYDVSGNSNDLTSSGTSRPVWTASVQNGKYGMVFDGINDYLSKTLASPLSQPNTYFVVARQTGDTSNNRNIFDGSGTTRNALGAQKTSGNVVAYAGSVITGSPLTTDLSLFTVIFNGASSYIYRNSETLLASGNVGTQTMGALTLGTDPENAANIAGNIESFICINASITAGKRNAIEAAINAYYAIY